MLDLGTREIVLHAMSLGKRGDSNELPQHRFL